MSADLRTVRIRPCSVTRWSWKRQCLVVTTDGPQVSDLPPSAATTSRTASPALDRLRVQAGLSNGDGAVLQPQPPRCPIIEDTCAGPLQPDAGARRRVEKLSGEEGGRPGGRAPWRCAGALGYRTRRVAVAFNIFMNAPWKGKRGRACGRAQPAGSAAQLRAECAGRGMTACSADSRNCRYKRFRTPSSALTADQAPCRPLRVAPEAGARHTRCLR